MDERHINAEKALEKLGGSYKLLKILLIGFIVKHSRIDEEIQILTSKNHYNEAQRIAHSIKGLSGNLCAEKLQEFSYILEKAYEEHPSDHGKAFDDFQVELHMVIDEIKNILRVMKIAKDEVAITSEDIIPMDISGISQFIDALNSFHYDRIEKAFDIFKHYEFPGDLGVLSAEIIELIDNYDYNGAKEVLTKILNDVKET